MLLDFKSYTGQGAVHFHLGSGTGPAPYGHALHNPFGKLPPILLCRHGRSQSNDEPGIRGTVPHPAVLLTEHGEHQAELMADYLMKHVQEYEWRTVLVVVTPMPRSHQTAKPFLDRLEALTTLPRTPRKHDNVNKPAEYLELMLEEAGELSEIDVGMYPHGVNTPDEAFNAKLGKERYELFVRHGVQHFSPYYHGESEAQVELRVKMWLHFKMKAGGPLFDKLSGIVIFGHSVSNNLLRKTLLGSDWPTYHGWETQENASVRLMLRGVDKGILYSAPKA